MGAGKRKNSSDSDGSSCFDENAVSSDENELQKRNEKTNEDEESPAAVIPSAFKLKREPCVCACSTTAPYLFISDYKGYLTMVGFAVSSTSSAPVMKLTKKIHNRFFFLDTNDESTKIASAGHGRTIFVSDVERGLQPVLKIERAHGSSISAICWYSENFVVTGDSKGRIKAFDLRVGPNGKYRRVMKYYENLDAITDFSGDSARRHIFAASSDSSMSTIDFRKKKFIMQSQFSDNGEMVSVFVAKEETKVVTGFSGGHIQIYEMGMFGVHSESLPIFEQLPPITFGRNLEKMCLLTDNIYAVADDSGYVTAFSLFPNRKISTLGRHKLSIDCLALDYSGSILATVSADKLVKFWDVSLLAEAEITEQRSKRKTKQQIKQMRQCLDPVVNFFADLD